MRRIVITSIISAAIIVGGFASYQSTTPRAAASPSGASLIGGRLIPIVTGATVLKGQTQVLGSFVNVSDCAHLDVYVTATASNPTGAEAWLNPLFDLSPDGTTAFQPQASGITYLGIANQGTQSLAERVVWNVDPQGGQQVAASPYVRMSLAVVGSADATNITAQLYCTTIASAPGVGGVAEQPDLPASVVGHGRWSYGTGAGALAVVATLGAAGWYVQRRRAGGHHA